MVTNLKNKLIFENMYKAFCDETKTAYNPNFVNGVLWNNSGNLELMFEPNKYFLVVQYLCQFNYIVALYVAPEYRRQKIATNLLRQFDYPQFLKVNPQNKVANEFFYWQEYKPLPIDDPAQWYYAGTPAEARIADFIINAMITIQKDNLSA